MYQNRKVETLISKKGVHFYCRVLLLYNRTEKNDVSIMAKLMGKQITLIFLLYLSICTNQFILLTLVFVFVCLDSLVVYSVFPRKLTGTTTLHQDNMSVCLIPPYTPLLYSKTGVYRVIHYFHSFALKHILWVLVRTASMRRF